jgi:hypothetical protein
MSVELSRRLARVALQEPIATLGYPDRRDIAYAAERANEFADLPQHFQRLILEAEAARERRIAAKRARALA